METVLKQQVHQLVDQLPASATLADLMRELYELQVLERAQADRAAGHVVAHDQARARIAELRRKP